MLFATLAAAAAGLAAGLPSVDRPQYICVNNNQEWDPARPASYTQASVDGVLEALNGTVGSADGRRRLCLSHDLWTQYDANKTTLLLSVDALLGLALANDLPLSLSIDATQWWTTVPQLWNWWDETAPGYSPLNKANVEWTGWSPANATSISWRDWGTQFRMPSPAPNIAAPAYRAAAAASMAPVAARIREWYEALPTEKRYLLAYIRSTQELSIGTNFYVYPGANGPDGAPSWPPSADPSTSVAGSVQLGFAALCIAGSQCSGIITSAALDGVIASFLTFAGGVLGDAGLPRSRIMSHIGTDFFAPYTPTVAFNTPAAAITAVAAPGFSLYTGCTNSSADEGLAAALDAFAGTPWGAPEWLPFFVGGSVAAWRAAFEATMGYRNNRLIVVQNWVSIAGNDNALQALVAVLREGPACLTGAPLGLASTRLNATAWQLKWTPGADTDAQTVVVSVTGAPLLPSGQLAAPILTIPLPAGGSSFTLVLPGALGPLYWQVVAMGCGGGQAAVADVVQLAASIDAF